MGDDRPLNRAELQKVAHHQAAVFVFYLLDGVFMTGFGLLGTLPLGFGLGFAAAGCGVAALNVLVFRRSRKNIPALDRNNLLMTGSAALQMLVAALAAPQIASLLLMTLMTVLAATALQLPRRMLLATCLVCVCGTAGVVLASPEPFQFPMATRAQRLLSAGWFACLLGKCALTSVEGTRLRQLVGASNLRLVRAVAELEKLATTDELTVLPNRRSILASLQAALKTAVRQRVPVAVALFDIDHFKRVNDCHGHAVGDEVLREFGALVSRGLRPSDSVGRYGGEEFLLVLQPAGTVDTARDTADRMRRTVESFDWRTCVPGLAITASAGVALVGFDESAESAIARADQALYRAKADGRNRVVVG